jgi:NADPH:quinone reductase
MKAIQVQKTGGPEVLTLVDLPVPKPKANEAIVKIAASGVNFIDVYFREGRYPSPLPFVDGQEGAGTVTEIGSDVKTVKPGDRVAFSNVIGTYAEYAAVPAERLVHVPGKITDQQAAAAMLQGMTAHYLVKSTYALKKGETALVHAAAGGVGLLLLQMGREIGARMIGTVGSAEKAKLARDAGAAEVINYTEQDFEAETKRLTDGKGVHVVYDGVGQTTFDKGHMVLFGASSGAVAPVNPITLMQKGSLTLTRPSLAHYVSTREELEQRSGDVFKMIGAGKLNLRIGHVYKLEEAQQAHRDLEGRKTTGKILLVP